MGSTQSNFVYRAFKTKVIGEDNAKITVILFMPIILVVEIVPYSYHNIQNTVFFSHHPIQIQDIAQGLPYYHPLLG
jgi:hypothetical protein